MSIGQNIKKYRKEKGYTQRELADLIGVSVQAVSKWETDTGAPDISQVVPLASALDISTDALFDYEHYTKPEDFEELRKDYHRQEVFRDQRDSAKNYKMLNAYFSAHPQNSEAASLCLKCLVDMIVAGKAQDRGKSELIAECEKYANCIFKYETDIDTVFMNHFVLARGYAALGENEKAKEMLGKIPVTFGDRLYWEAEIAQANKEYDDAMLKCRSSFAWAATEKLKLSMANSFFMMLTAKEFPYQYWIIKSSNTMSVEKNLGTLFVFGACPEPHLKLS